MQGSVTMSEIALNVNTPYILNGEFFEIISREGESVTVRCCYCEGNKNIYKGSVKSTGNFHMHIKRKHPSLIARVHESKLKAFLARRFLQQQRRPIAKKRIPKSETNSVDDFRAETGALNLKTNQNKQVSSMANAREIKNEPRGHDEIRHIRNLFAIPGGQALLRNPFMSHHFQLDRAPTPEQIEPTNLSKNQQSLECEEHSPRIENTLQNIERELHLRNQIETNRLCFELAKFRYMNPDFDFRM